MTEARRYRSLPVVIEAIRYEHRVEGCEDDIPQNVTTNRDAVFNLAGGHTRLAVVLGSPDLIVETLEGRTRLTPGNYLVRGTTGELYPVRADIFESKYEAV